MIRCTHPDGFRPEDGLCRICGEAPGSEPRLLVPMTMGHPGTVRMSRGIARGRDLLCVTWPDGTTDSITVTGSYEASLMMLTLKGAWITQGFQVEIVG